MVDFTPEQKQMAFDTMFALGLQAMGLPWDHLRDAVDPSFVNKKDDRIEHEKWTSVLFHGLVSNLPSFFVKPFDIIHSVS